MRTSEAKQLVIKAGRELSRTGLIERTWGNVSVRTGENSFVITASGKAYDTLTEDEVIEVDIRSGKYEGETAPSSEYRLHARIYEETPDTEIIIHTHQNMASAVSAMGVDHVWFDRTYDGIGPGVLVAKYALPGTKKLSGYVAEAVRRSAGKAVIMQRHGVVCRGSDYDEVFDMAHDLETACEKYLCSASPMLRRDMDDISIEDGSHYLTEAEKIEGFNAFLNRDRIVMDYIDMKMDLGAYLDDYAQMIGPAALFVPNDEAAVRQALGKAPAVLIEGVGALCIGQNGDEAAVSMLVRKNCIAYFAAASRGKVKKISPVDSRIMRRFYVKKYSKMEGK